MQGRFVYRESLAADLRRRTRKLLFTNKIVTTQESGNAWYSTVSAGFARNTVRIQTMRNAQVPTAVITAGQAAWPLPRSAPAGISYRLQSGS